MFKSKILSRLRVCVYVCMSLSVPDHHLFQDVRVSRDLPMPRRTCTKSARKNFALKFERSNHAHFVGRTVENEDVDVDNINAKYW